MTDHRPYAALLAKGEDRRQRIIGVAQRLVARQVPPVPRDRGRAHPSRPACGAVPGRHRPGPEAVEIIAFVNGMESSWLLDPSIPLADTFTEYAASIARQPAVPDT
jgi:hypothetical protein